MKSDKIAKVAIDSGGKLQVFPASNTEPIIKQEAVEARGFWRGLSGCYRRIS